MQKIEYSLSTLEVAEMLETEHWQLLRRLEGDKRVKGVISVLADHNFVVSDFFTPNTYKDASGKENKCYQVTRLGCDFLANKFTGEKGVLFTARYVKRFHEMEEQLLKENHMDWFVNDIRVFQHKEFGMLRALKLDGEDYFIGQDATKSLGYVNNTDTLKKRVSDSEKCYVAICDGTRSRKMVAITKAGLSELIKTGRLPLANKYNEWIKKQVFPALIEKDGVVPVSIKTEPLKEELPIADTECEAGASDAIGNFRVLLKFAEQRGMKINTKALATYKSCLCGDKIAIRKGLTLEEINFELAFELYHAVVNYDHGDMINTPLAQYYNDQAERAAKLIVSLLNTQTA